MASTQLTQTGTSPPNTNSRQKWTFSFWIKRTKLGTEQCVWTTRTNGSNNHLFRFNANNTFTFKGAASGSDIMNLVSNRVFKDTAAWYHFVLAVDSTQGTASNRARVYVNGSEITSYSTADYGAQNENFEINEQGNQPFYIGSESSQNYFDGLMSYFAFVSGKQELPTIFGETDSTTGEWKIKTTITPSSAWGTNGFFILKNGNSVTDQSGNSNNFQVAAGTLTNLKDNPSDNFCSMNHLYYQTGGEGVVINNCGNTVYYAANASRSAFGSFAPSSGKYYFEAKVFSGTGHVVIGIMNMAWSDLNKASGYAFHDNALNFGYNVSGQKTSGGTNTAYGANIADNDIIGVAMDLDNSKLYFSVNGAFQGSGVPTSGASGTNAAFTLASGANYTAACRLRNGTQVGFNFGNGQYSGSNLVTTNSGDGYSGAEGSSKFSYQPPTGYSAISTKGLNE